MNYLTDVLSSGRARVKAGARFGRLFVLGPTRRVLTPKGVTILVWHCRCDCGTEVEKRADTLRQIKSCGCISRERSTTHGHRVGGRSRELVTWESMLDRCRNPNFKYYHLYGGRGIKVCDRWLQFANFLADMGPRPSPEHTLDRIDSDGDYNPGNCRWATRKEQASNRRNNRKLTAFGQTLTASEWARRCGLTKNTLFSRLRQGWDIERTLSAPIQVRRR